jgi:hypothetical protein
MVITLRARVLYGSQNKQGRLPYTALTDWFCITERECVYCVVRTESLCKTNTLRLFEGLNKSAGVKFTGPVVTTCSAGCNIQELCTLLTQTVVFLQLLQ